jgi:hypothetical protein
MRQIHCFTEAYWSVSYGFFNFLLSDNTLWRIASNIWPAETTLKAELTTYHHYILIKKFLNPWNRNWQFFSSWEYSRVASVGVSLVLYLKLYCLRHMLLLSVVITLIYIATSGDEYLITFIHLPEELLSFWSGVYHESTYARNIVKMWTYISEQIKYCN